MKIIKNILGFIIEPFKFFHNKNLAEKVINFFHKRQYLYYIMATVITLTIIFFAFIYEKLVN